MEALRRVKANTVEKRLLNGRGNPAFGLSFYMLNKKGEFAGVSMYQADYAVCTANGPETRNCEPLLEGRPPTDHGPGITNGKGGRMAPAAFRVLGTSAAFT